MNSAIRDAEIPMHFSSGVAMVNVFLQKKIQSIYVYKIDAWGGHVVPGIEPRTPACKTCVPALCNIFGSTLNKKAMTIVRIERET